MTNNERVSRQSLDLHRSCLQASSEELEPQCSLPTQLDEREGKASTIFHEPATEDSDLTQQILKDRPSLNF